MGKTTAPDFLQYFLTTCVQETVSERPSSGPLEPPVVRPGCGLPSKLGSATLSQGPCRKPWNSLKGTYPKKIGFRGGPCLSGHVAAAASKLSPAFNCGRKVYSIYQDSKDWQVQVFTDFGSSLLHAESPEEVRSCVAHPSGCVIEQGFEEFHFTTTRRTSAYHPIA